MSSSQRRIDRLQIATLVELKVTGGYDGLICHCVEQDSFYRYVSLGASFTADDMSVIITGDGGSTRWISGEQYHYKKREQTVSAVAGEVDIDVNEGLFIDLTLTGSTRINNPSNFNTGDIIRFSIKEDGSGPYTLIWGTKHLDLTATNVTITDGGATATLLFNTPQDLSMIEVGDILGIWGASDRNNGDGYIITAVNDATDTITMERPNGAITETLNADITIESGSVVYGDRRHNWVSPNLKLETSFNLVKHGQHMDLSQIGKFRSRSTSSSAPDELEFWDDFWGSSPEGVMFDWAESNGNNGNCAPTAVGVDGNHPGIMNIFAEVDAGSRANLRTEDNGGVMGAIMTHYETLVKLRDLADATEDCYFQIGMGDDQGAGEHAYGVYFFYDWLVSPNWLCKTANAGVRTTVDTGIPVEADRWYKMTLGPSDGDGDVKMSINGIVKAKISTNLPYLEKLGIMHKIERYGLGTRQMRLYLDYAYLHYMLIGQRDD